MRSLRRGGQVGLQRYASWMLEVKLDSRINLTGDTLFRLPCNSPGEVLCPRLDYLCWDLRRMHIGSNRPLRLFFPPNLKYVSLYITPSDIPSSPLEPLVQMISRLSTSFGSLFLQCGQGGEPLRDTTSSFVYRCGTSLGGFRAYASLLQPFTTSCSSQICAAGSPTRCWKLNEVSVQRVLSTKGEVEECQRIEM